MTLLNLEADMPLAKYSLSNRFADDILQFCFDKANRSNEGYIRGCQHGDWSFFIIIIIILKDM